MSKWAVIVPTYAAREEVYKKFLAAWTPLFAKHEVYFITMCDNPEKLSWAEGDAVLSWKDIDANELVFIPKRTDMVRSYAMWRAYNLTDADYFLTLDDDCLPQDKSDIFEEYEKVFKAGAVLSEYFDVGQLTSFDQQMRGFPYKDRKKVPVAVQYGGWSGVLDYDAATQLSQQPDFHYFKPVNVVVPKGTAVTCCIMNCAWQREYTPIMWQLPMLDGRYNRVGDIWSGLFIKKTLDTVGAAMVINGKASIFHDRASNPYESLKKEAQSVWLNDNLWEALWLDGTFTYIPKDRPFSVVEIYKMYTDSAVKFFAKHDKEFAEHFLEARDEWLKLWMK